MLFHHCLWFWFCGGFIRVHVINIESDNVKDNQMLTAHFHLFHTMSNKTQTTAGYLKQIIQINNLFVFLFSETAHILFHFFFILWLQFNYNLQISLNFISFSQGFSFQIGYCEVDDQLPGRSIPQYTLYLTVANEKERVDWIRALRAGKLKEYWRKNNKEIFKMEIFKMCHLQTLH